MADHASSVDNSRKRTAEHLDEPHQIASKKHKAAAIRTGMHPELVESLTPYDINRKPRPSVEDDKSVTFPANHLLPEFRCPLCEGVLVKTMTAMECLHRFCNDCISKYIRIGRKECPMCSVKLSSMRVLRPDSAFDGMIQTIFPPPVRAMPLVRREANLDRKIQLAHNEEEREDDYVGLDDEMSPRKGGGKRGTPSKRGRGGKIVPSPSNAPMQIPTTPNGPTSAPPPRPQSPTPAQEKTVVVGPVSTAVQSIPKNHPVPDKQQKSQTGPKRARSKRNPDSDKIVLLLKSAQPHDSMVAHPYVITPARTTVASLKQYLSSLSPTFVHPVELGLKFDVIVSVTTASGSKESLPDDFALGSAASRSIEAGQDGHPVVYFEFVNSNTS